MAIVTLFFMVKFASETWIASFEYKMTCAPFFFIIWEVEMLLFHLMKKSTPGTGTEHYTDNCM